MKVLITNGSAKEDSCTYTALAEVAGTLNSEGIETEIFQLGNKPIAGCIACLNCAKTGECIFKDKVNEFVELAKDFDGFVFGTPVHYGAASGSITSFMDRVFYSAAHAGKEYFYLKPAAAVAIARRAGTVTAFDQLNRYFTISEMPVISSSYWNNLFGETPDEAKKDPEGLRTMRVLAHNMAWFLRCKEAGEKAGIALPKREVAERTNFIDKE